MASKSCLHSHPVPQDIMREIFLSLPVKSLIRFKSLSKDCAEEFKIPTFIAQHLHHSTQKNPSLFYTTSQSHQLLFPNNFHLYLVQSEMRKIEHFCIGYCCPPITVVGCCNGLLCLSWPHVLSICNPATKEFRWIKLPRNKDHDPSPRPVSYIGFGFSSIVNDFKIVSIHTSRFSVNNDTLCVDRVEVYSLRSTGQWREIEAGNLRNMNLHDHYATVNGALFWWGTEVGVPDYRAWLISFEIGQEVFKKVTMPPGTESSYNYLAVYKDSLAVLSQYINYNSNPSVDLWVMEDIWSTGESWTKLFTLGPYPRIMFPLAIWRGEVLFSIYGRGGRNHILSLCYPNDNHLMDLPFPGFDYFSKAFNYAESLVPVGGNHITYCTWCSHTYG